MKKNYKIKVDCANCAAKIERAINKIKSVENASINFMTQKLTVEAEEPSFESTMKDIIKTATKVEKGFEILQEIQ